MQVTAHLRNLRMSPRKVRLVADLVGGMDADEAAAQLVHLRKGAALPIRKLLHSAVANAEHNAKLDRANLFVRQVIVNQGATLKRFQPRAFGRATPLRKRTSHITIVLDEHVPTGSGAAGQQGSSAIVPPPAVVSERPTVPHDVRGEPLEPERMETETRGGKRVFDVRRKGKHRHQEHEDARSAKRPGGFFKRLFTRRSGER